MRHSRRAALVAAVASLGLINRAHGAPLDPFAFPSLGTFNVPSGAITINTDTAEMHVPGPVTYVGGFHPQGGGNPNIAVFDFSSFTIAPGVTVNIVGSNPLAILSRGSMSIGSALNLGGGNGGFLTGGGSVLGGGIGGPGGVANGTGGGPGGGGGSGIPHDGGGGGFGGAGGAGDTSSSGGAAYGNLLNALQGGSGGAGGTNSSGDGGGGGAGGGAIELGAITTLSLAGINARGGNGGNGAFDGGGGSGGAVLLHANSISSTGVVDARGGNGFEFSGGGGGGRMLASFGTVILSQASTVPANLTGGALGGMGNSQSGRGGFVAQHFRSLTNDAGATLLIGTEVPSTTASPWSEVIVGTLSLPTGSASTISPYTWQSGGGLHIGGGSFQATQSTTFSTGSNLNWASGALTVSSGKSLTFDGGTGTVSNGTGLSNDATLAVRNGGLLRANQWFDIANSDTGGARGTMIVSGPNSRIIAGNGGGDWTDWGRNVSDVATISFDGQGVGTYNSGIRIANNGGRAEVEVLGGSQLNTASLQVGGTASSFAILSVQGSTLHVLGPATFNTGAGLFLDIGVNRSLTGTVRVDGNATFRGNASLQVGFGDTRVGGTLSMADTSRILMESLSAQRVVRAGGLSITGSSQIDLADNAMIVGAATPKSTIQSYIVTGRSGGTWNQLGLTSNAARNHPLHNTTLGLLSGAEFNSVGGGGTLFGEPYAPTDTLVRYTYYGDTDFNGQVNFDDYNRTDAGFNNNRSGWLNGDFDLNNTVNFDDYSLIDLAFNTQGGTVLRAIQFLNGDDRNTRDMTRPELGMVFQHFNQFGESYATSFLTAVPEPCSIAFAAVLLAGLRARRRVRRQD